MMQREKMAFTEQRSAVKIEETAVTGFQREESEKYSFRVYDKGFAGIYFNVGKMTDDEGFGKAEKNLVLERPYKYQLESGVRSRDLTEEVLTDRQLIDIANETVAYLKEKHPEFTMNGSVAMRRKTVVQTNSAGLDLSDTDSISGIGLSFKHRDSKDISDGYLSMEFRTFDLKKFTDMADEYLNAYLTPAELPEELIIQMQYYDLLNKLDECLDAERMALGTSLFSGKTGQKIFSDRFTLAHDVSDKVSWGDPFFDGEGVTQDGDRRVFIDRGVLVSGYSDKHIAEKYGVPHTGNAWRRLSDIPVNGNVNLHIDRSESTAKQLLDGRYSVFPVQYSGGGWNDKGGYAMPVQCAFLCDGGHFIGKLPPFTMKGELFDMFGDGFIGVTSDDPIIKDKQVLLKMQYGK